MNGKIILTLFILFYHKDEVKAKKMTKNEELFMNEDLIFYENEPKYNVKRQVNFNLEVGSGLSEEPTTLFDNTTFFTLSTEQTTLIISPCDSNPCPSNTTCFDMGNSFDCECNEGFVYNNVQLSCQDKNECELNISNCTQNEICVNTIGGFRCICKEGFELVNNNCEQISTQEPLTDMTEEKTVVSTTKTIETTQEVSDSDSSVSTSTSTTSTTTTTPIVDQTTEETTQEVSARDSSVSTSTLTTSTTTTTPIVDQTSEETTQEVIVSDTSVSTSTSTTSTTTTTSIVDQTTDSSTVSSTTSSTSSTTPLTPVIEQTSETGDLSLESTAYSITVSTITTQTTIIATTTTTLSSTTTSTTTTTTTTTTSTTPIPIVIISGKNDESIKSLINDNQSYQFFSPSVDLSILGSSFNSFRIHSNGFVSFGNQAPNIIRSPTFSISNFNFPLIAPLWTSSILDTQSDIKFGVYEKNDLDQDLVNNLKRILNPASAARAVSLNIFEPELIYSITWENLKESTTSDKRATFQLFITISFSQETAFAIFNYVKVEWTEFNQQFFFIGLTDGKSRSTTNRFSANGDSFGNPALITAEPGNTGQNGAYVYDLNFATVDRCTRLINEKILNNFLPATRELNFFITCPLTDNAMIFNPFYIEYRGRKWQNARCYKLRWGAFYRSVIQQFCCYNQFSRNLIIFGRNSGFAYNSPAVEPIMNEGAECCSDNNNWNNCRRFYNLYPFTLLSRFQFFVIFGWGGGDPHMTTFDDFSYTFNGLGKFVFTRAKDKSFEVQGLTSILANANGSSELTGTLFTSFAFKTRRSRTFQIDLVDGDKARPFLALHIDKQIQVESDFSLNFAYQKDFKCVDNSEEDCTTIIQNENGTQFLFDNGLSLSFSVTKVSVSAVETRSWITCSVNFIPTGKFNYQDQLEGLMGNWNGDKNDDIIGRDGQKPSELKDRFIYDIGITWQVTADEDLFTNKTVSRTIGRIRGSRQPNYRPLFLDDLVIDPEVNRSCNANIQCIFDATASGIPDVGQRTLTGITNVETAIAETSRSPPSIVFGSNRTEITWYTDQTITLTAGVLDTDSYNLVFDIENITEQSRDLGTGLNRTVSIQFKSIDGQLPKIGLIASDETNLNSSVYFSEFYICKCQSLSKDNKCRFDLVQEAIETTGVFVACECDNFHEGEYCDRIRNECLTGNVCDKVGSFNQTCEPLSVVEQKSTGRGYKCIGPCPNGYESDEFGACKDIFECAQSPPVCKDGSTCLEKVGSFECVCPTGYRYVNEQCELIDLCLTTQNNCVQICSPIANGVQCSCHPGFAYDPAANTCTVNNVAGCDTFGCSNLCSSINGQPQCFCPKGFKLDTDNKTCIDVDECLDSSNCPSGATCKNTDGSFECECETGTKLDLDTFRCIQCPLGSYGKNCEQTCNCITDNSLRCDPKLGCVCSAGFEGVDCSTEINACEGITNTTIQTCVSRFGERVLICAAGYILQGIDCVKIDYCEQNPCNQESKCTSLELNFTCTCNEGFTYNYITTTCDDIAECDTTTCPENSDCKELPGSYECECRSGFEDINNDNKSPQCQNIDECARNLSNCAENRKCVDNQGDYDCICVDGYEEINQQCVLKTSTSSTGTTTTTTSSTGTTTTTSSSTGTTTTTTSSLTQDNTGLILVIVLPILGVLILGITAGLFCFFKMRSSSKLPVKKNVPLSSSDRPGPSGLYQRSMFEKKDIDTVPDLINFDENGPQVDQEEFEDGSSGSHSTYRPSYLFDKTQNNEDVFKTLEDNARSSQKKTIGRPQSLFTGSSFSVPTAYHETTTPYGDFAGNRGTQDQGLSENDIKYFMNDEDTFDAFDNDDDLDEIIEAFNPNVKIPRPKIQLNPLKIFKFGNKNAESEN